MAEEEAFEFGDRPTPRIPYVLVTLEFWDGTIREYWIGETRHYWDWRLNEDNCLVFKTHRYVNRTVVPLAGVRSYTVFRSDAEKRETPVNGHG